MMSTTITVSTPTRGRLRRVAEESGMTEGALIESLLDEHEEAGFWQAVGVLDPEAVRRALAEDGDKVGDDYRLEDAMLRRHEQGE